MLILFIRTPVYGQTQSSCSKNNCHPMAICIESVPNSYRCECIVGHRDMNPANPGRKCVSMLGFNECTREEDNECSENAKCIDLAFEYTCKCLRGYEDVSPKGTVPGSNNLLNGFGANGGNLMNGMNPRNMANMGNNFGGMANQFRGLGQNFRSQFG
uniref:EGF-like domain-containing protein n=1 Tax=Globodera rostochiensis TaxID=31243 RepID=A0A914H462_GLORO